MIFAACAGSAGKGPLVHRVHPALNLDTEPIRIFVAFAPSGSQAELRQGPDFRLIEPGR